MATFIDRIKATANCRRGSTIAEMALVAPILFFTVIGIFEVVMILFVTVLLEGSVRESARFGITGWSPTGVDREANIRAIVDEHTMGLVEMTDLRITTLVYSSFGDIGQPEPYIDANANGAYDAGEMFTDVNGNGQWDDDMGRAGVGGPGEVVLYTLSYDWPLMTGLHVPFIGTDGKVPLRATVAVRNEPF